MDYSVAPLQRCPFCFLLPQIEKRGMFWRGGCAEHIPDAVMMPLDRYWDAVLQWNNIIEAIGPHMQLEEGE